MNKKVLFVCPYFPPSIGGVQNYISNISLGLKEKYGWEVVIITSNHENPKELKEEKINGIKVYRLPIFLKISNTPINVLWYWQIRKIIRKEQPDVINGHSPVPFIADIAARVAKSMQIPFILTYHNDLIKEGFLLKNIINLYYFFQGNHTFEISEKIIATSNYYANNSKYLIKHKRKLNIVSPGVNISGKNKKASNEDYLLFVGQLDKTHSHKGLEHLINAFSKIKEKVKLYIVGKGNDIERYKKISRNRGIEKRVIFLDKVGNKELESIYEECKLLVLPSTNKNEGFGMVLIEAMSHKKPVIGSRVGGIPYVISNNVDGILVPPSDSEKLTESINYLLKNPKIAKKMGENGYKKVKNKFTWEIQVKKTNKLLENLR